MSEKQVKRRRLCEKLGFNKVLKIGGRRWLSGDERIMEWPRNRWLIEPGPQAQAMSAPLKDRQVFIDYCRKRYAEMAYERANSFGKQECAEADLLERSPDGLT